MSNLELWDKVRRVPEEHLKGFKRGGGFTGTAIKPMWSIKTMTEQYGPCGIGWGIHHPRFKVVQADNEILVYCTVAVWHVKPENTVFGVGGDKVRAQFSNGPKNDDEAFKKAFTDAVTNALKFLGVGADIHMGLWDGNKYVDEPAAEKPAPVAKPTLIHPMTRAEANPHYRRLEKDLREIRDNGTLEDLERYWKAHQGTICSLEAGWKKLITEEKDHVKETLKAKVA